MRVIIEPDYEKLSQWAANYVIDKINAAQPTAPITIIIRKSGFFSPFVSAMVPSTGPKNATISVATEAA